MTILSVEKDQKNFVGIIVRKESSNDSNKMFTPRKESVEIITDKLLEKDEKSNLLEQLKSINTKYVEVLENYNTACEDIDHIEGLMFNSNKEIARLLDIALNSEDISVKNTCLSNIKSIISNI